MLCSHCGKCCEETEMMLCKADISRLEKAGYTSEGFVRYDKQGYAKLRNRRGYCVFYDLEQNCCRAYRHRPLGCRVYPVIYSEEEGIVVDYVCPMRDTVQRAELRRKGSKVVKLLEKIDSEAAARRLNPSPP